ncbi:ribosome-associated translation inhibitor RaiA [Sphingomonas sp. H39-1-10]|uniref:ribosome hibernation-promoting factor, HPF/YfiA family n=1 Tax=Sphingomonas TaxID=13687 RepID=UPI000885222F|nr:MULTISPECIES: ribosome-associated translation inhibitor RaiA [Sphingomonas]MDF0488048.1 ribosome-associated translation inhibitor RaiA [Sphingomonas pollutisoli]SDA33141.1 ribosomal subunit interface protein [Sphingomonas sp. NFR15]
MDIRVSGHQVETGEAIKVHVDERLQAIATKYFARAISAQVTFGRGPHEAFTCDIVAHVMQGLVLKANNSGMEAHVAFDGAADKIEKQLRRYMRRLKDRSAVPAGGATIADDGTVTDNAGYTVFQETAEEEIEQDFPPIIAETRVDVPDATVSDAVMMLDLRNTTALLFRNVGSGAYNMVYRRGDGTIGWVEPHRATNGVA